MTISTVNIYTCIYKKMKMNGLYATFVHIIGLTGPAEPPEDESDDTAFQTQS